MTIQNEQPLIHAADGGWLLESVDQAEFVSRLDDRSWIQHYNRGLRSLYIHEDLAQSVPVQEIAAKVRALNYLASQEGVPAQRIGFCSGGELSRLREESAKAADELSRRAFFLAFRGLFSADLDGPKLNASNLPHSVVLEMSSCTACADCVKICPDSALSVGKDAEGVFLGVDPSRCDGCGLCVSVCPSDSITISNFDAGIPLRYPVQEKSCEHCQQRFFANPKLSHDSAHLQVYCGVCSQVRHPRGALRLSE